MRRDDDEPLMDRRIVITGLGVVTSMGWELDTFWDNVTNEG